MSSTNLSDSTEEEEPSIILTLENVNCIEKQLLHYEKIAMAFLFYDSDDLCLKVCKMCLSDMDTRVLGSFVRENPPESWSMKVLECLFYIKNYFLLNKYGLTESDASNKFRRKSFILPHRITLYKICESLTLKDTKLIMESVSSITEGQYLEVFFLSIRIESDWAKVHKVLCQLNAVQGLVQELGAVGAGTIFKMTNESEGAAVLNSGKVPLSLENRAYPIRDPGNVGLCLIINEMNFFGTYLGTRFGSDKDVEAVESTMKEFNFDVVTRTNQPSSFFGLPLAELIIKSLKKIHSVFFFVILSHGSQGVIFSSDEEAVSIEKNILKTLSLIKPLRNLPKVLIIQACQGEKYLLSSKVVSDGRILLGSSVKEDDAKINLAGIVGSYISDSFIAMSTVPGFKSFRQPDKGSFFIQMLCHCLRTYPYETIQDIVTEVIKLVKEEVINTKLPNNINFAQQPEFRSLLDKKLYLKINKIL